MLGFFLHLKYWNILRFIKINTEQFLSIIISQISLICWRNFNITHLAKPSALYIYRINSIYNIENPMDRGAWWAIVHRVIKSQKWLKWFSTHIHTHTHIHICIKIHPILRSFCLLYFIKWRVRKMFLKYFLFKASIYPNKHNFPVF